MARSRRRNPARPKTKAARPRQEMRGRYRPRLELLEDRLAPATFAVVNTQSDDEGSLRWAIEQANTATGPDQITLSPLTSPPMISGTSNYRDDGSAGRVDVSRFATVPAGHSDADLRDPALMGGAANVVDPDWLHSWWSIQPTTALPTVTSQVTIDGYTQPGREFEICGDNEGLAASP